MESEPTGLSKILDEYKSRLNNKHEAERDAMAKKNIADTIRRIGERPWPACSQCGGEFLLLRASGRCGFCDPPDAAQVKPTPKQVVRDFMMEILGEHDNEPTGGSQG